MVFEQRGEHGSQWAAIESIAGKIGCSAQTLSNWVRQYERDTGQRDGVTPAGAARVKEREREGRELKKANEILAWPARISLRRSSTAATSDERFHRQAPRALRGRANQQGTAGRPVRLSTCRGSPPRCGLALCAGSSRRGAGGPR